MMSVNRMSFQNHIPDHNHHAQEQEDHHSTPLLHGIIVQEISGFPRQGGGSFPVEEEEPENKIQCMDNCFCCCVNLRTSKTLVIWNGITCAIHFLAMLVVIYLASVNDRLDIHWRLKKDSVFVGNSPGLLPLGFSNIPYEAIEKGGGLMPAEKPLVDFPFFGGCLRNSEYYHQPNEIGRAHV